jgi:hypothetical protein
MKKLLLAAALASSLPASSRRCLERRRLGGLQSKAGYDRIFERVTKAVEPMVDGVCQKWDCVTHWYPPNMIVTKDEQPDGSVPLGSSMCSYFPPNGDKPSRLCVNNKGEEWAEYQSDYGWIVYQRVRSAWAR